ncbi:hypothetical protein GLYMA_11G155901v4 [Glycine max]|nr:hypothetical protein GLYMA_11G155901v4 [Glycine max]KAH1159620.1 hypothetical protein GYH30_031363 [Glycine max]KAH1225592.1 hypothetical protein GmHk_11G032450 [Glycine max]
MQESDGSNNSNGSTDDEVALMSGKFKQMIKKNGKFQNSSRCKDSRFNKKNKEENNEIIYFKCRKPGHMQVECPQLMKKRYFRDKKKKSLMVIWDDSDREKSSSFDAEQANICLMEDTNDKIEVKTCSESDTFSCASSDDEAHSLMMFFFRTVI